MLWQTDCTITILIYSYNFTENYPFVANQNLISTIMCMMSWILSCDENLPWQCQPKMCNIELIAVCITLGQNFILYTSHWHPSNELGKFWVLTNCFPWKEIGMRATWYRIDQTQVWSLLNNPGCSKAHCN